MKRVETQKVLLEYIVYDDGINGVKGFVRISNLCYRKIVSVRITQDNWMTFIDFQADYFSSDSDFLTDRFVFSISCAPGNECCFAICYQTESGVEFWDNNHSQNYKFNLYHN